MMVLNPSMFRAPLALFGAMSFLVGCASKPVDAPGLAAPAARISDEVIHRDHQMFAAMQSRHQALNATGTHRVASYPMAKAQCWMDVAFHEYHRNDRTAFPQGALAEAERLIAALEAKRNVPTDTPLVDGAAKLRNDLWTKAEALKKHRGFRCIADRVACAEVELVHAGHEYNQGGWRYANPYVRIAEDRLVSADQDAAACPQEAAPSATAPVPAPAEVTVSRPVSVPRPEPTERPTVTTRMTLNADALFAFDRSDAAHMKADGRARIDALVEDLKKSYASIEAIRVLGHADRLGGEEHNRALSMARATTVAHYMVERGIDLAKFRVAGVGSTRPVVQCGSVTGAALVSCLAPNRRVDIMVEGVRR